MGKSVCLQKVTKLIVDGWFWDGPDWKQRRPQDQDERAQSHPTQSLVASKTGKPAQKFLPHIAPAGRRGFCEGAENSD